VSRPPTPHGARLASARDVVRRLGVDGLIVSAGSDVRHLSGFRGEDASLVVGADVALICTDSRFFAQVHEEVADFELTPVVDSDLVSATARAAGDALGATAAIGFQGSVLSYSDHRTLRRIHRGRLRNVGDRVSRLRDVKDETEIEILRRAGALVDEALGRVLEAGIVGSTETDVAWRIRTALREAGADDESFATIVAAGERGALAHAIPGRRRIRRDELVVIDTGARVDGYCSDITRTYATGEIGGELRRVYEVVLAAQLAGLAAVRDGAHGSRDVDAAARAVIDDAGYGDAFGHGTGHGVGLDIHEFPRLGKTNGDRLAAGMVCTVEPGIYLEGVAGVRIEDTVLVTERGCERLTLTPKELRIVG
jgi:Xaa-Pro aminopeptidase